MESDQLQSLRNTLRKVFCADNCVLFLTPSFETYTEKVHYEYESEYYNKNKDFSSFSDMTVTSFRFSR